MGRPLSDLKSLSADTGLSGDAHAVLQTSNAIDREIETEQGAWFMRRILPYRTGDNRVDGVVITFTNISERKASRKSLEDAMSVAEVANVAKSRFLAAASHDLRQPLQTLTFLQGLLAKSVVGDKPKNLVARLDQTLLSMTGMLNSLLDINQIEAGTVKAVKTGFALGPLLANLRDEFSYAAESQKLDLRVVKSRALVQSDARLLEQILRNLIANALKYTKKGKVLVGCRVHGAGVTIEVWDTGVGIPQTAIHSIFNEFYQFDNAGQNRNRGLGLGLAIVKRLTDLLGHEISVTSMPGHGSVFKVSVPRAATVGQELEMKTLERGARNGASKRLGNILIIEDDPEVRNPVEMLLASEGHKVVTVADAAAALELAARGSFKPHIILSDYNLPHDGNGVELTIRLREIFEKPLTVIILTGDISTETLRNISAHHCVQLNKPVRSDELTDLIQQLLKDTDPADRLAPSRDPVKNHAPQVFIVDDDAEIRHMMETVLEAQGNHVHGFASGEEFLEQGAGSAASSARCLVVDAYLPGLKGIELLQRLAVLERSLPTIMITGNSDVAMAVDAMKSGVLDFLEKPVNAVELLASVARALEQSRDDSKSPAWHAQAVEKIARLTKRQHEVMDMVVAGHPSKNIAADLGLSQRTVETHRAAIMHKTGSKSLPALARLALAAVKKGAA